MPPIDPSAVANSRLADTAPALVGVVAILIVVLGFVAWILLRVAGNNTRAIERLADVLGETRSDNKTSRAEDHAWHTEKIRILSGLTAQMQSQGDKLNQIHGDVLHIKTSLHADVRVIRDRLGKD